MQRSFTRRFVIAAGSLALVAASVATAAAAAPPNPGPNIDISRLANNEAETTVAINPLDVRDVVVVSNVQVGDGLALAVSRDGGTTWTTDVIGDGDELGVACCDPSLAFDGYGNLFLTYLDSTAKRVQAAWSIDGGATFHFLKTIEQTDHGTVKPPPTKGAGGGAPVDQPTVTTGSGTVWVTYKQFSKRQSLMVRGASVLGLGRMGAWAAPSPVPGSREGTFGDIVIGPRGEMMVTYQDNIDSEGPSTIWVNTDPDGLGPQPIGPAVAVGVTGVGGFDFIPSQSVRSVDAETGLAWDKTNGEHGGRVYLVYTDEQPDESDDTNIWVRYSDDAGATWTTPIRVNDDTGSNSQFNPHIAVDQTSGVIGVGWHDARLDQGQGGGGDTDGVANDDTNYFVAVSTNGGTSFGTNVRVSAGTSNGAASNNGVQYGDYTGMAFMAGVMHPAWADNSNSAGDNPDGALSRFDLYTSSVVVP
jgi:hypothetical protein